MVREVDATQLAVEFDVMIARAGLTIPGDRRAALMAAFVDLRGEIARLYDELPPELEPAAVWRLDAMEHGQ